MADNGGKGRLNEKEVLSVVRQLNEQIPESVIRQRFKVGSFAQGFDINDVSLQYDCMLLSEEALAYSICSRVCTMCLGYCTCAG